MLVPGVECFAGIVGATFRGHQGTRLPSFYSAGDGRLLRITSNSTAQVRVSTAGWISPAGLWRWISPAGWGISQSVPAKLWWWYVLGLHYAPSFWFQIACMAHMSAPSGLISSDSPVETSTKCKSVCAWLQVAILLSQHTVATLSKVGTICHLILYPFIMSLVSFPTVQDP